MAALDHRIPPPVVVLLTGAAMVPVSLIGPAFPTDPVVRYGLGGGLVVVGLALFALGLLAFRRAKTTIDPLRITTASELVTGGVFRVTRNPMYLGFTAILVGWATLLASPWAFLGPVAFAVFTTRFQVVPEERAMGAQFGRAYADYRGRVRRWL